MYEVPGHKVGKLCMLRILAPTCVRGRDGTWSASKQLEHCELRCVQAASSCDHDILNSCSIW